MKENMEERAERLALYIIENRSTVRAAAQRFGISKSTVHTERGKWNGQKGGTAFCRPSVFSQLTAERNPLVPGSLPDGSAHRSG